MDCGTNFDFTSFGPTNELLPSVQPFSSRGTESYLHTSPPSFPQSNTYNVPNQTAYMQQELSRYKERCNMLERELLKVSTERDLAKSLFEQFSGRVGTATLTPPAKKEGDYPNVRFWRREAFSAWTRTAEASTHTRCKLAYLEDEAGKMISEQTLKALRKKIKSAWKDLAIDKGAPKKWGGASASAKENVYKLVYKHFTFMELSENDWKMDELCGLDYPGWVRNNTDSNGNWLDTTIIKNEDDTTTGGEQSAGTRKRKANSKGSQPPLQVEKKLKHDTPDDSLDDSPAPASSETESSSVLIEDTSHMRISLSPTPSSASSLVVVTKEDRQDTVYRDVAEVEVGVAPTDAADVASNKNEGVTSRNTSGLMDTVTGASNPTIGSGDSSSMGMVIGASGMENRKVDEGTSTTSGERGSMGEESGRGGDENTAGDTVKSFNPLQMLSRDTLKLKIPPLAIIPPLQEHLKSAETLGKGNAAANKDRKMRIPKNKTPYYLCAHRWLKQVNKTGTNEQFRHYWYKVLSNSQREVYKTECNDLIEKDLWNNDVCNGAMH